MKRLLISIVALFLAAPSWAATCKISEYANMVQDAQGREVPVAAEPAIAKQEVDFGSGEADSDPFDGQTRFVGIVCDAKAHFEFGTAPTAETTDPYLPADTWLFIGVEQNVNLVVSFIGAS